MTTKLVIGFSSAVVLLLCAAMHAAMFGVVSEAVHEMNAHNAPCVCEPGVKREPTRLSKIFAPLVTGGAVSANADAHDEIKQGCPGGNCSRVIPHHILYPQHVYHNPPAYHPPVYHTPVHRPAPLALPSVQPMSPIGPVYVPTSPPAMPTPLKTQARYNLAIFLDNSQNSQTLANWFNSDRELAAMKSNCALQVYTLDNEIYRTRFATIVPAEVFPAVLFMAPDGGIVHKVLARKNMPASASQLVADLKLGFAQHKSVKEAEQKNNMRGSGRSWDANPGLPGLNLGGGNCPGGNCGPDACIDGNCDQGRGPFLRPLRDRDEPEQEGFLHELLVGGVELKVAGLTVFVLAVLVCVVFVLAVLKSRSN